MHKLTALPQPKPCYLSARMDAAMAQKLSNPPGRGAARPLPASTIPAKAAPIRINKSSAVFSDQPSAPCPENKPSANLQSIVILAICAALLAAIVLLLLYSSLGNPALNI
jgi:hypothetical protein